MIKAQAPAPQLIDETPSIDLDAAWQLVLGLAKRASVGTPAAGRVGYSFRHGRWLEPVTQLPPSVPSAPGAAQLWFDPLLERIESTFELRAEVVALLELFLPLVTGARADAVVIGHLGQSLDGRVATHTGASQFITGREDVVHTHRLRALSDAVIVGVRTVQLDDPQLTTRLVAGAHPARVVLDPQGKLRSAERLLLEDDAAPTLVVTAAECAPASHERRGSGVEWLTCPVREGCFELHSLRDLLAARGLSRLFIEGGGVTVSHFLAAGMLDRLHVSVAPLILGSGAPAFVLPPIERLDQALPLRCRHFALGPDLLFDCQLLRRQPAA